MERYVANRLRPSAPAQLSGDARPGHDFPEIAALVDAVRQSKTVFDMLEGLGAPGDVERLHDLFAAARDACAAVLSQIETAGKAPS